MEPGAELEEVRAALDQAVLGDLLALLTALDRRVVLEVTRVPEEHPDTAVLEATPALVATLEVEELPELVAVVAPVVQSVPAVDLAPVVHLVLGVIPVELVLVEDIRNLEQAATPAQEVLDPVHQVQEVTALGELGNPDLVESRDREVMVVPLGLKDHMDLVAPLDLAAPVDLVARQDLAAPVGLAVPVDLAALLGLKDPLDLEAPVGLAVPVDLAAQLGLKDPLDLAAPLDLVDLVAPEDLAALPDLKDPLELAAPLDLVAQADIQDPVVTPVLGAPEATLALEDQVDLAVTLRGVAVDTDLQEALAREALGLMENPALVHILDLELQALIQSQDLVQVVIQEALDLDRSTEVGQVGDIQVQDRDLIQALLGRVHIRREVTEADLSLAPEAAIRDHRGQARAQVVVMVAVLLDHFLSHLHHLTRDLQAALAVILAVVLVLELQAVRALVVIRHTIPALATPLAVHFLRALQMTVVIPALQVLVPTP